MNLGSHNPTMAIHFCKSHPTRADPCAHDIRTMQTISDVQIPSHVSQEHIQTIKPVKIYLLRCSSAPHHIEPCCYESWKVPVSTTCKKISSCHQTDCGFVIYVIIWVSWSYSFRDKKTSPHGTGVRKPYSTLLSPTGCGVPLRRDGPRSNSWAGPLICV